MNKYGRMDAPNMLQPSHIKYEEIKRMGNSVFLKKTRMRSGWTPRYTIDWKMRAHNIRRTFYDRNRFYGNKYPTEFFEISENPVIKGL